MSSFAGPFYNTGHLPIEIHGADWSELYAVFDSRSELGPSVDSRSSANFMQHVSHISSLHPSAPGM